MALSKSIPAYTDVHQVLDAALSHGGGLYRLETPGKALHWRMRANHYRKLLRESPTPILTFDTLIFRVSKSDPCIIQIEINKPEGVLTTLSGDTVPPSTSLPEDLVPKTDLVSLEGEAIPSDPLEEEVFDLAEKIKGGKLFK